MTSKPSIDLFAAFKRPVGQRLAALATACLSALAGAIYGIPAAFLVLASAFLLLSLVFVGTSLKCLQGETKLTLDEALSLARPSAEEEQKQAVLRALKDLDYERSVGKISETDYHELSAHYRKEAKRLIALVDETQARRKAEIEELARVVSESAKSEPKKRRVKKKRVEEQRSTEEVEAKEHT